MERALLGTGSVFIAAITLALMPLAFTHAASDYYIKLPDIKGETQAQTQTQTTLQLAATVSTLKIEGRAGTAFVLDGSHSADDGTVSTYAWRQVAGPQVKITNATQAKASVTPQSAGVYSFELTVSDRSGQGTTVLHVDVNASAPAPEAKPGVEPDEIDAKAASPAARGSGDEGKVETVWKVEKGENSRTENDSPDDISNDGEPQATNFAILLGGGGSGGSSDEARSQMADIVLLSLQESGVPVEHVSLNFEKITATAKQKVKLFGFISVDMSTDVDVDTQSRVQVRMPWWSFLTSGKDENLGQTIVVALSSAIESKHEALMGIIQNTR